MGPLYTLNSVQMKWSALPWGVDNGKREAKYVCTVAGKSAGSSLLIACGKSFF